MRKQSFIFYICLLVVVFFQPFYLCAQASQVCSKMPKEWIAAMKDPILDTLISYAKINSSNILQALDNIMQSKYSLAQARAGFFPSISLNAGWNRGRESSVLTYSNNASLYATAQWEIDLFGSIRNKVKSASDLYKVSIEDYKWVMLSLCAEVAQLYINLRTSQQQLIVDEQNVASQKKIYELTQARYKAGLASKLDVLQSGSVLLSTQAAIPLLETKILKNINSITTLLGTDSEKIKNILNKPSQIPRFIEFPDTLCMDIPIELIIERPDIKSAEYTVASYAASLGATKADWWPKFYFNGTIGFSNNNFSHFFERDKHIFTINPTISWTIFSGRQLQASSKFARMELDQAINNYNQAILTAIADIENSFSHYYSYKEQIALYNKLVLDGREELKLSVELYKMGLQNFQTVLDVLRSLLTYESSLVTAKGNMTSSIIMIYKNLSPNYNHETR